MENLSHGNWRSVRYSKWIPPEYMSRTLPVAVAFCCDYNIISLPSAVVLIFGLPMQIML